jgi:hypothetical protein
MNSKGYSNSCNCFEGSFMFSHVITFSHYTQTIYFSNASVRTTFNFIATFIYVVASKNSQNLMFLEMNNTVRDILVSGFRSIHDVTSESSIIMAMLSLSVSCLFVPFGMLVHYI